MTKTANILRFDPNGPNGLEEWEQMDYSALVSGEPVQHGHLYHEIEACLLYTSPSPRDA